MHTSSYDCIWYQMVLLKSIKLCAPGQKLARLELVTPVRTGIECKVLLYFVGWRLIAMLMRPLAKFEIQPGGFPKDPKGFRGMTSDHL